MKINDLSPDIKELVTVVPFDPGQHTSFNKFFLSVPAAVDLQSSTFVIANQTDRAVVGLAIRWILSDSAGNQEAVPWFTHSYLSADVAPVIDPRGKMMVAPGSFVPDTSMKSGGFMGTVATDRTVRKFKGASGVSVEIDSVIFADGEVLGPKSLPLVQQIKDRQLAADLLVRHLNETSLKGGNPRDALQEMVATPSAWGASVDREQRILVRQLESARDFDSELQAVKRLKKTLNFHRKDGSPL